MMTFRCNDLQVTLRNPDLRDRQSIIMENDQRRTMSGRWRTYITTPLNIQWEWDFSAISREKTLAVISFVAQSAGKQITVIDHLNRTWKGYFLTDVMDFATVHICNNVFKLTFEGFQY
jgi:hypothetical protein